MRIVLIHALRHSMAPVEAEFARLWPETRLVNLLDDSLSADLAQSGALTQAMTDRFLALAGYAVGIGADGVLFTCSAFGPCIDACAAAFPAVPMLKPNEAMIKQAVGLGGRIGLLATFEATLASMPAEFPPGTDVVPCYVPGALEALDRGDTAEHDRLAVAAARQAHGCDVLALAQFSLARAAPAIAAATGQRVLTTPESAVQELKRLLAHRH